MPNSTDLVARAGNCAAPWLAKGDSGELNLHQATGLSREISTLYRSFSSASADPDGNCQFRALSYQLYGTQEHHAFVRARCCDEMQRASDDYAVFFEPGTGDFEAFVRRMRRERTWGDELTLRSQR